MISVFLCTSSVNWPFFPDILELSSMKLQNYFMIFSKTAIKCHKKNTMKQKSENLLSQISY